MQRIVLVVILAVAAAARLWFLHAGIPHAVGIDEPQVIGRSLAILRSGDWNPHIFDYPTLVIYLHAAIAIARFLLGAVRGEWNSLDAFAVDAVYETGRVVAALIGVLTVYLTYRLARELSGRPAATLAAALLAVHPLHVRESHFILTDVPMVMLTTLALWLAVRAARRRDTTAYAWAGALCGLAAAAKYTGGVVLIAPLAAWAIGERAAADRWRKLAAIVGAAAVAFLAGAPYTVLDMPAFLDGFAAQFARFAGPPRGAEPAWLTYLKHLSPSWGRASVPLAIAGMLILLTRAGARRAAIPVIAFALAFFYVVATHSLVFGRYALPLVPVVCIMSAVAVLALAGYVRRFGPLRRPAPAAALLVAVLAGLLWPPAAVAVRWLDQYKEAETRTLAADWLKANAPKGARVATENSGPTYLDAAGFRVAPTELLLDHPIDWYRSRVDFLVISSADLSRYGDYLTAGPTVFQIAPTSQRWGPPIRVVRLK
ncbi:MAG TPA: glycosyltransferase family 39 protein [Vicinamibacterales bacterium]|nr:glycosyltransferase family 39 protein [Vicinamibacterales bacterium]